MSVLSAYCVFILLHIVHHCVLLFSCTRCWWHSVCQYLLLDRFFSVRLCSSTCIWGIVLVLLRFCSHVVSRLCPCFYIEASSSYFMLRLHPCIILRLCPHILFWGFGLVLYWGFVLIFYIEVSSSLFYFEASSSYFILRLRPHCFILRLCPHILFWGFVLIFYIEASSSYFILRLRPHILYWGLVLMIDLRLRRHCYILRLCSSVWGFGRHCCRPLLLCLYCLFGLFAVICVWFCLFVFCLG